MENYVEISILSIKKKEDFTNNVKFSFFCKNLTFSSRQDILILVI